MKRKILAGLLSAAVLVAALTACDAGAAATTAPEAAAEAVEEAVEEVAAAAEEVADAAAEEWDGDVDEIEVLFFDLRGVGENAGPVIEAMNEITAKTAGVVIGNSRWASVAEYGNAVSLALSSGEQLDLVGLWPADPASFQAMVANGQLYDITELMAEYGQETLDMMGDYIYGMSNDGRILGLPCWRNYSSALYLIMRNDILEDLGLM